MYPKLDSMSFSVFIIISMTGFAGMSKQKNPPAKISDGSQSRKRAWVWGYTMGKLVWGRTTVYLQLFGVNISSGLPTSNYKSSLALAIGSSDWTLPPRHRGFAYFSPLTTGLVQSPTGRIISPSKVN